MDANFTKESIQKELARIQATVPKEFRQGLLREEIANPEMVKVLEEALKGDFPEEKKEGWRFALKEASQKTLVEHPKKAAIIDRWIAKEIKKSVKAGRLPTKKQLKKLNISYEK